MQRRAFIKVGGLCAYAMSISGVTILQADGATIGNCATTTDLLGPFFRENAPFRNDLRLNNIKDEVSINVIGKVYAKDCKTVIPNALIDIWHCDEDKNYDMESDNFKCRGRFYTNENGAYQFRTFIPPPYGGRPKHIHYMVHEIEGHQKLITQLYFKGDKRIKPNNWIKYKWDDKRILDVYKNDQEELEIELNLYLTGR